MPWYYRPDVYDDSGMLVSEECNASLMYCQIKNSGWAKTAGDPAAFFMLVSLLLHFLTVIAVYSRWAGRSTRLPHSPKVIVTDTSAMPPRV